VRGLIAGMHKILLLQLETKVGIAIILVVITIFLITIFENINNFNKVIEQTNADRTQYEEVRLQKNP